MNTPIYDFVNSHRKGVRAHMPGHKGISPLPCGFSAAYDYDITEIKDADALFEADGIIAESEKNAASLFGTAETIYSCAGSTACIQATLAAVCKSGDTVIAARNCHRAFINTCVLLGLNVRWIYPHITDTIVSGGIYPEDVERALESTDAACVYLTSPDYLGRICDIGAISEICRRKGVYLLVDNAHGAYTAFLEKPMHPIALGADMCCDSAHKTLPVLTGGAYLHSGGRIPKGRAKECMSMFCSTSPSYLILQSLDLCNRYLSENFRAELDRTVKRIDIMKQKLSRTWELIGDEPLKVTIHTASRGLTGTETADILRESGIECEYADSTHIVLMLSPMNSDSDFDIIEKALSEIPMPRIRLVPPTKIEFPIHERAMSIREAALAESEEISSDNAAGRICARAVTACPPGIAVAAPGEIFTEKTAEILKMYGIDKVRAVK